MERYSGTKMKGAGFVLFRLPTATVLKYSMPRTSRWERGRSDASGWLDAQIWSSRLVTHSLGPSLPWVLTMIHKNVLNTLQFTCIYQMIGTSDKKLGVVTYIDHMLRVPKRMNFWKGSKRPLTPTPCPSELSQPLENVYMHFILSGPWTSLHIFDHIHYKKFQHNFPQMWGGGGLKSVWNISENSPIFVAQSVS